MYVRRSVVRSPEDGGGEGGAGGSGGGAAGSDDIESKIKAAVEEATAGLMSKNQELLGKLTNLKGVKEQLAKFEGMDPDKIKDLMARFDNDEEAKLLKDGKIDEVLDRRYAKRDADWQRKLKEAEDSRQLAESKASKFLERVLNDRLREAFTIAVEPLAMSGALLQAKQIFSLDDEGNAVQLDKDGHVILGKDKTPFSPKEWIESEATRKEFPYLYPVTGSGTGGSQQITPGNSNADLSKMSAREKMNMGRRK